MQQVLTVIFDIVWLLAVVGFLGYIAIAGGRYVRRLGRTVESATRTNVEAADRMVAAIDRLLEIREYFQTTPTEPRLSSVHPGDESAPQQKGESVE